MHFLRRVEQFRCWRSTAPRLSSAASQIPPTASQTKRGRPVRAHSFGIAGGPQPPAVPIRGEVASFRGSLVVFGLALGITVGVTASAAGQAAEPLSLQEAITLGETHHPSIASAQAAVEGARAAVRGAQAAQLPTLTVAEDAMYSNDPVFAFGSELRQDRFTSADLSIDALNHPGAIRNFSASATANWTAFDAGAARRGVRSARHSLLAAQLESQYTGEQIATSITTLYFRALMAEDEIAVATAALKRDREIDGNIRDRVRAGLSLDSDGARADLSLRNAQDDLAAAKNNVTLARLDLFDALGVPPSDRPLIHPSLPPPVLPSTGTLSNGISTAKIEPGNGMTNRLDLQAIRLQQQAAREKLSSIKASAWPTITTFGHVENDAENVVSNGSGNWMIGAKIQMNLFDGGARKAQEQQAAASIERLDAQERSTLLEAHSEIAARKTQIEDLGRSLATAESAIGVQQQTLTTARDRYATGLVTITEVLDGENDLTAAEFQRVRTFYQLCIANAELALADGSLTSSKAGRP